MKLIIAVLLLSNVSAMTFDIFGTFENNDGCRVFNIMCSNYEQDGCRFELYVDGEYEGFIGKGGRVELSDDRETIKIKDRGLRSTMTGIPGIANRKATITNFNGIKDPGSYTDLSITNFDLEFDGGLFSKSITCQNLRFVDEY
ncbi:hypothetical protein [Halobacteriovorax sp.]|uniref:hypothetical protein n=1 Tax=Halobacteriovorax sp. TaxID=2020862 RepID=UPI003AF21383